MKNKIFSLGRLSVDINFGISLHLVLSLSKSCQLSPFDPPLLDLSIIHYTNCIIIYLKSVVL